MSILLIIPPSKHGFHDSDVCLSFGYLASFLKKERHDVKIFNLQSISEQVINKIIKDENPKIVGIRCLTNERNDTVKIAKIIKKINKEIKIVIGGPHAAIMYKQILNRFPIDYVLWGGGEIKFLGLVNAVKNKKNTEKILFPPR